MMAGWRVIPPGEGRGLLERFGTVLAVALIIAGIQSAFVLRPSTGFERFSVPMVYSVAISVGIWAAIDPVRFLLRGVLRAEAPGYWPPRWRATFLVGCGTTLGYTLGTLVGDAWAGQSTLELLQRNPSRFVALIATALAISIGFAAYFVQRGHREALEGQTREARLALLQSQLEPHMLFNTLANLRVLIGTDAARAQSMLDHLIGFLRSTLAASRSAEHPLRAEFERLGDYLALMQVRMGARLTVRLDLPADLADRAVPPLLLQPLVENAIRHGLEPKSEGGTLLVSATANGRYLTLVVRDSGVGLPPTPAITGGFGLAQVRERLLTRYGSAGTLVVSSVLESPGGTVATISIPMGAE
jgi:signal transduction histidine kinase